MGGGGGIFNNRQKLENNRLLFKILFYGNFFRRDKALMEGTKVVMEGSPSPPTRENPGLRLWQLWGAFGHVSGNRVNFQNIWRS